MFGHGGEGSVFEAGGLDAGALTPEWALPDPDDPWSDYWGEPVGETSRPGEAAGAGEACAVGAEAGRPAGVDLATMLAGRELAGRSAEELVEAIAGWERVASWARASQARAIAALTRCPEMQPSLSAHAADRTLNSLSPVTICAAEVSATMCMTTRQAENLVGEAVRLVEDFPVTLNALATGRLDPRRATVILDELGGQDAGVRAAVEAALIAPPDESARPDVPDTDVPDSTVLRRRVRAAVHELAPITAVQRNAQARAGRFVRISPAADGMAWLEALLPAEDATAVKQVIDAAAATLKRRDRAAGDAGDAGARTVDQRRADALAAMAWASLETGRLGGHEPQGHSAHGVELGGTHGRRAAVEVTVSLTTLAGLDDQPGELAGYGPIPARVARELSAAGVWRWIRRDPGTGALLDLGRTRYTPTHGLAQFIIARDRECRMPGCHRSARSSQLDHTVAFPHGPTAASNLGPLCQTHHLLKHHSRWRIDQPEPGVFVWTSPTGRIHVVRPDAPSRARTRNHGIDFDNLDAAVLPETADDDLSTADGDELGAVGQPQPSPITPADTADTAGGAFLDDGDATGGDSPDRQRQHPPPGGDPSF